MDWWAWRLAFILLCLCISAIIISCVAANPSPVLTPAELPPITLTLWIAATSTPLFSTIIPVTATPAPLMTQTPFIYIVHSSDSLEEIANDFGIEPESLQIVNPELRTQAPQVGQTIIVPRGLPTLVPVQIELMPPTCYATPSEMLLCMGYVRNTSPQPVERVSALVELLDATGKQIDAEIAAVEQGMILPGDIAPYRVLFGERPYHQMIVSLRSADLSNAALNTIAINQEAVLQDNGDYVIEALLSSDTNIGDVRVIATVYNADQEVVGYRIIDAGAMDAEVTKQVRVSVQPVVASDTLTHTLHVEGR